MISLRTCYKTGLYSFAIVGAVLLLAACSSFTNTNATKTLAVTSVPGNATSLARSYLAVGQQASVNHMLLVTVTSASTVFSSPQDKLGSGRTYVVIDLSVTNTSTGRLLVTTAWQSTLIDMRGQRYAPVLTSFAKSPIGALDAGARMHGQLAYAVPMGMHQFLFTFEANLISTTSPSWNIRV